MGINSSFECARIAPNNMVRCTFRLRRLNLFAYSARRQNYSEEASLCFLLQNRSFSMFSEQNGVQNATVAHFQDSHSWHIRCLHVPFQAHLSNYHCWCNWALFYRHDNSDIYCLQWLLCPRVYKKPASIVHTIELSFNRYLLSHQTFRNIRKRYTPPNCYQLTEICAN